MHAHTLFIVELCGTEYSQLFSLAPTYAYFDSQILKSKSCAASRAVSCEVSCSIATPPAARRARLRGKPGASPEAPALPTWAQAGKPPRAAASRSEKSRNTKYVVRESVTKDTATGHEERPTRTGIEVRVRDGP